MKVYGKQIKERCFHMMVKNSDIAFLFSQSCKFKLHLVKSERSVKTKQSRLDLKLLLFNHYHDLQPTQNIGVTRIGRYLSRSTASGIDKMLLFTSITTAVQPSVSGAAQTRQIKSRFCSSELI